MPRRGDILRGQVIRIKTNREGNDIGALVKLESGEVAFLPVKEVSTEYVKKISEHVNVGDEVSVVYVEYNKRHKEHNVSLKRANKDFIFQKNLENYLKDSSKTLRQIQKNKERKQSGKRKRPTTKNNNN